jgi:hypothetical protein
MRPTHVMPSLWTLDPTRSVVGFQTHGAFGLFKATGRFDRYETRITAGGNAAESSITAVIHCGAEVPPQVQHHGCAADVSTTGSFRGVLSEYVLEALTLDKQIYLATADSNFHHGRCPTPGPSGSTSSRKGPCLHESTWRDYLSRGLCRFPAWLCRFLSVLPPHESKDAHRSHLFGSVQRCSSSGSYLWYGSRFHCSAEFAPCKRRDRRGRHQSCWYHHRDRTAVLCPSHDPFPGNGNALLTCMAHTSCVLQPSSRSFFAASKLVHKQSGNPLKSYRTGDMTCATRLRGPLYPRTDHGPGSTDR